MWCGGVTGARHTPGGLDFGSAVGEACPQDVLRLDDGRDENRREVGLGVRGVWKGKHYPFIRANDLGGQFDEVMDVGAYWLRVDMFGGEGIDPFLLAPPFGW